MNFNFTMRGIQRAVIDAGGEWIGIQDAFPTTGLPSVVFRSPSTKQIIIFPFNPHLISEDDLCDSVRKALAKDLGGAKPEYISVRVDTLQKLAKGLREILAEVEALLERKKL